MVQQEATCSDIDGRRAELLRDSKRTMILLFFTIGQLYIIRISRGILMVLGYFDIRDLDFWDVVIPCSRCIMLYGIAYSIVKSVNTSIIM